MIYSLVHPGSGLGNQLHRIIAGKVLALDKGYEYSVIGRENFKGKSFMNLDMGRINDLTHTIQEGTGKILLDIPYRPQCPNVWEEETNYYNPEFSFIEDDTIIDGDFQDERYFGHRLREIDEWLSVEPLEVPDDVCVIGFRGGEYALYPDLFLPMKYWMNGVEKMKEINPDMKFRVVTDDPELAKTLFPFEVTHEIGHDWRSIRFAKYSIIPNSSFYILPRLLRHRKKSTQEVLDKIHDVAKWAKEWKGEGWEEKLLSKDWVEVQLGPIIKQDYPNDPVTIAPVYWSGHNKKEWNQPQNYYRPFLYI